MAQVLSSSRHRNSQRTRNSGAGTGAPPERTAILNQKDKEITYLQQQQEQFSEVAVKQGVARREEELCVLVMRREEEVAVAIVKREEQIMEAVCNCEAEVDAACLQREKLIRTEVNARIQWVLAKESKLKAEEMRLEEFERSGE